LAGSASLTFASYDTLALLAKGLGMGLLRYFLALIVLCGHVHPKNLLIPMDGNGAIAVQSFFVISGFYMSLISDKYKFADRTIANLKAFYLSRFLRIYPLYLITLAVFLFLNLFDVTNMEHKPFATLSDLSRWLDKSLYVTSNLLIIGQGVMRFLVLDPVTHSFYINPLTDTINPHLLGSGFAILGQAWTLSLELTFYLLAPFLLSRSVKLIATIFALSFLLRYIINLFGYESYNLTVAFFPTSLGIFLLGSLAHRLIYMKVKEFPAKTLRACSAAILALIIWFSFVYYYVPNGYEHKHWGFIVFVALAIPFLFATFKSSKVDNFIGELSYPVYMLHLMCIGITYKLIDASSHYAIYFVIGLTTLLAILLTLFVIKPIDKIRRSIS
jgi:peptidoglycan/LPS O-acetylase OafA/YrhL